MRRTIITLLSLLGLASISIVAVWAANPHFKKGPSGVDNGLTATVTGTIAGLGKGDVIARLNFPDATGTTTCTNQNGKQEAGQNLATPVSGSQLITKVDTKLNGVVSFTVTTDPPPNPTPQAAGCPNGNWSAAFDNITFGNGTLAIQQDQGGGNFVTVLTKGVIIAD